MTLRQWTRVGIINSILFVLALLLLETFSYTIRYIFARETYPILYQRGQLDDCIKMTFHPLLGRIHDAGTCALAAGKIHGQFVVYGTFSHAQFTILTLGGSTTDGFYQHYSRGKPWPYFLQQECETYFRVPCVVINGGTGGYSTAQEFLKLTTEAFPNFPNIDLAISLSGINDLTGYDSSPSGLLAHPFLQSSQIALLNSETFVRLGEEITWLPNLRMNIQALRVRLNLGKTVAGWEFPGAELTNPKYVTALGTSKFTQVAERWGYNLKIMSAVSEATGAQFIALLQPTLGLDAVSAPPKESNDFRLYERLEPGYLEVLNRDYESFRRECLFLVFCHDISRKVPATGDDFSDGRHYNELGNKKLADEIGAIAFPILEGTRRKSASGS